MSQRTESPEFTPGFLWQIVFLTVIALGLVLLSDGLFKSEKRETNIATARLSLFPWTVAGSHTLENGLLAFSGKPAEAVDAKDQVRALTALLVVSVLCPTVFLLRWRRRKLPSANSSEPSQWRISRVFYGLCGAIVLYLALMALPIAVYGELSRQRLREAQAIQSNRDAIHSELHMMTVFLSQYYILPKEYGGGNHSYDGYKLPESASNTAEASYVVTANGQEVAIRAESAKYPGAWVELKVDSAGRKGWWKYEGKFQ